MTTQTADKPLKIWQRTDNGKTTTVSVWADRKVRTGYFEPDFWSTLHRSTVPNLTDSEWKASPGSDWQDITDSRGLPAYRVFLANGTSYVTSMARGITLEKARAYFVDNSLETTVGDGPETFSRCTKVEPA